MIELAPRKIGRCYIYNIKSLMLVKLICSLVLIFFINSASGQNLTQGPIDDNTYLSTVRINQSIHQVLIKKIKNKTFKVDTTIMLTGTGFFVYRTMPNDALRVFLVTNKHMVGDWSVNDTLILNKSINVSFYTKNGFRDVKINLLDNKGNAENFVHPHPNQVVDVVVLEITQFVAEAIKNELALYAIPIDGLVSMNNLNSRNIFTGSQVFITGYPSGLGTATQNKPLVKSGFIASPVGGIDIIVNMPNRKKVNLSNILTGKILLIDGYIVGGNSGGPVFTPLRNITTNEANPYDYINQIIGIVSSVYNNTGLSLIYSTDYIKDLIYKYTNN